MSKSINRVLYVVWQYPKYSETFVQNEIDELRSRGVDVRVVTVGDGDWDLEEGERSVIRLPRTPQFMWVLKSVLRLPKVRDDSILTRVWAAASAARVVSELGDWKPDVVHVHFIDKPTALGLEIGRLLGVPVSVLAHARDYLCHVSPEMLRHRLRAITYPFAISHHAASELGEIIRRNGQAQVNVEVVRATPNFNTTASAFAPTNRYFVTVARLVEKKGIDTSIRAFAVVARTHPDISYMVVGSGPLETELKTLALELGVEGRITFTGPLKAPEAQARIAHATAMVLACRVASDGDTDGIPVVLMEAGLAQIPVLTTAVGGIDELVRPDQEGWIVEPDDVASIAKAMIEILESPDTAATRASALRDRVNSDFSAALQGQRLMRTWLRNA